VDPDGAATRVADGVHFPNGLVMTPGGTLVVAETLGEGLTAFAVALDGEDGRTLFLCAGPTTGDGDPRTEHRGVILPTRVDYGTS
jgi:sugar lactone lactonase YvrE